MTDSRLVAATALWLLVACSREAEHDGAIGEAPASPAASSTDGGHPASRYPTGPRADEVSEDVRRAAVLDVIAGGERLRSLPEIAVDPGSAFDPELRQSLYQRSLGYVRMGVATVGAGLPVDVVSRIVRQNYGRFRLCYWRGLAKNPDLKGRVTVAFAIHRSGTVIAPKARASDLPDAKMIRCVVDQFAKMSFPKPEGKSSVSVVYPIGFAVD